MSDIEANTTVENIVQSGPSKYRWRVLGAASGSYFYDSYDLIVLSIAMPAIIPFLGIDLSQGGLLGSATMLGAMLGSIIMGVVAENYGRKNALMIALVGFGILCIPIIFIQHFVSWLILRFFCGLFLGGVWGPCIALINSHWEPKHRGRAGAFCLSTFAIGGIIAALCGRFLLQTNWKVLFLIGATAIFVAIWVAVAIPNDRKKDDSGKPEKKERIGVGALFQPGIAKLTIFGTLLNIGMMGGYWGVSSWIPTYLLTERGLDTALMANYTIVVYVGMFIGYQLWGSLADKLGRKKVMMICFLCNVVCVILFLLLPTGILFFWGAITGLGFGGVFGVMGAFYGEMFPERISALGGGFCFNIGRIGSVIAPFTVGALGDAYGLTVGIAITPAVFAIGLIACFFLPETKRG